MWRCPWAWINESASRAGQSPGLLIRNADFWPAESRSLGVEPLKASHFSSPQWIPKVSQARKTSSFRKARAHSIEVWETGSPPVFLDVCSPDTMRACWKCKFSAPTQTYWISPKLWEWDLAVFCVEQIPSVMLMMQVIIRTHGGLRAPLSESTTPVKKTFAGFSYGEVSLCHQLRACSFNYDQSFPVFTLI